MKKIIFGLCIGFSLLSCHMTKSEKDNYSKDLKISNAQGIPKDSFTFYFPTTIQLDTNLVETGIDTFKLNLYSSALYSAKETILYNYYLGHDIYRFLWLRSFHRPVVISIHKDVDKVWLIIKELNKQPEFLDELTPIKFVPPRILPNGESDSMIVYNIKKTKVEIIKKADRKADIILNQTIKLTTKEWNEFENLLNICSFWTSKPYIERIGLDGAEWTIEAHLRNKYWYVNRWSPDDNFRKAGEYLIKKSGLKEEIY